MKEILCSAKSFITFDFPLNSQYIGEQFLATHDHYRASNPHWCLTASRRKVISDYWFRHVLVHFGTLYGSATLFVLLVNQSFHHTFFVSAFAIGIISFCVLFITHYWLFYYSDFLPKLDTVIARHEQEARKEEKIEKCRRTQFSIPTLTIIFYVFSKDCNFPFPACNDQAAELLNNLYGSDKDKLKENLRRIYKPSSLSPKERAEFQKGINNARGFFKTLGYREAALILDKFEIKLTEKVSTKL
jgi:hypothetical protein